MKNIIKKISIVGIMALIVSSSVVFAGIFGRDTQLVNDGNMEKAGVTDWVASGATAISKQVGGADVHGSQIIRFVRVAGGAGGRSSTASLVAGKSYRIIGSARGDGTSGQPIVLTSTGSSSLPPWVGSSSTSWQRFDVIYTPTITGYLWLYAGTVNGSYTEWDNISVTEYKGTIQNREVNLLVDANAEASGTTAWTTLSTASVSKQLNGDPESPTTLRVTPDSSSSAVYQSILDVGSTYRIRGKARGAGGTPRIYIDNGYSWVGSSSSDWQYFDFNYTVTKNEYIRFYSSTSAGGSSEWDDLSVTLVKGNVINRDVNLYGDGNMETANTTNWVSVNLSTLSKAVGALNTTGSSVLRVTNTASGSGAVRAYANYAVLAGEKYRIVAQAQCEDSTITPLINRITGVTQSLATGSTGLNFFDTTATMTENGYIAFYNNETVSTDFVALGQTSRSWIDMTVDSSDNVYAAVNAGDIYKQTGGTGDFVALGQTSRIWLGMAVDSSDNVYAIVINGDIYKQTGGAGDFVALGQTTRNWRDMTVDSSDNVYAIVYNGDIYKKLAPGVTSKYCDWDNISVTKVK